MKEVAYVSLFLGFLALVLVAFGSFSESNFRSFECDSSDYVYENYGQTRAEDYERCYEDRAAVYDMADLTSSLGNAIMLFSLILMIGANRLQD